LRYGLEFFYAQWNDPDGRSFLEQATTVADRALREEKYRGTEFLEASFPQNHGFLLRVRSYANALLGHTLDEAALHQAAIDCEEYSKKFAKKKWDSHDQADYLAAVRLALVAGDLNHACRLLDTRKSFKWHFEEFEILKGIADGLAQKMGEKDRVIMLALLDSYFNKIRDPNFKPDVYMEAQILRLELGAIRDKYFISGDGVINWQRVIEAISA